MFYLVDSATKCNGHATSVTCGHENMPTVAFYLFYITTNVFWFKNIRVVVFLLTPLDCFQSYLQWQSRSYFKHNWMESDKNNSFFIQLTLILTICHFFFALCFAWQNSRPSLSWNGGFKRQNKIIIRNKASDALGLLLGWYNLAMVSE